MGDYKLEIKKVNNGFILKGRFDDSEEIDERVIEESDLVDNELEVMRNLLFEVKEYFGVYYSKHNVKNLTIDVIKEIK